MTLPRPGHADLTGVQKSGFDDIRNVLERSSARETAIRVALASVCRKLLKDVGIEVGSRVIQIHNIIDDTPITSDISPEVLNEMADKSSVRCLKISLQKKMIQVIDEAKSEAIQWEELFEVIATGIFMDLVVTLNGIKNYMLEFQRQ